jgi:hypothetical protein
MHAINFNYVKAKLTSYTYFSTNHQKKKKNAQKNYIMVVYLHFEFITLHCIIAYLKNDVSMVVDIVERKVRQGVLVVEVILLIQCRKDGDPVGGLGVGVRVKPQKSQPRHFLQTAHLWCLIERLMSYSRQKRCPP